MGLFLDYSGSLDMHKSKNDKIIFFLKVEICHTGRGAQNFTDWSATNRFFFIDAFPYKVLVYLISYFLCVGVAENCVDVTKQDGEYRHSCSSNTRGNDSSIRQLISMNTVCFLKPVPPGTCLCVLVVSMDLLCVHWRNRFHDTNCRT